jgi:hypothetical protein
MPSRTTPVIPGSRTSSGETIIEHVEVPITVTNVDGLTTPAPGTATQASTLPTATATSAVRPSVSARSAVSVPALVPSGTNCVPSFSAGSENPG